MIHSFLEVARSLGYHDRSIDNVVTKRQREAPPHAGQISRSVVVRKQQRRNERTNASCHKQQQQQQQAYHPSAALTSTPPSSSSRPVAVVTPCHGNNNTVPSSLPQQQQQQQQRHCHPYYSAAAGVTTAQNNNNANKGGSCVAPQRALFGDNNPPLQPHRQSSLLSSSNSFHHYLLVVLERPPTQSRWGLCLAVTDDGHVQVLPSKNATTAAAAIPLRAVAWQTVAPRPLEWWWQYSTSATLQQQQQGPCNRQNVLLEQFVHSYSWHATQPQGSSVFKLLQQPPGEKHLLVAVNGLVLSGPCQELPSQVLQTFKTAQRLCMLLTTTSLSSSSCAATSPASGRKMAAPAKKKRRNTSTCSSTSSKPRLPQQPFVLYRNPLFGDPKDPSLGLPFADDLEFEIDDGQRAKLFVKPIDNVTTWIKERKRKWRTMYTVYAYEDDHGGSGSDNDEAQDKDHHHHVPTDFWTPQGFVDLGHWIRKRKATWRQGYSWQRAKRQRLQHDVDKTRQVSLTQDFPTWLRVRKTQWRLARRQRQRAAAAITATTTTRTSIEAVAPVGSHTSMVNSEVLLLDSLLEEKEERERQRKERAPLDISWLFDSDLGCPDDVVAHIMGFLDNFEHGKLMAINRETRCKLAKREVVWRLLCPPHWTLPRRPRQPWHVLYWTKLQTEHQEARKRGDELLTRALNIVAKGDHLASVERLVKKAEKDGKFDIDYSSGVVCERNSLLNLAVIHERHKIVRWLIEVKRADIESEDRGQFTPLLNAAWAGDKVLVRFLLGHGANRRHVGTSHYTRPLAPPDFEGRTAAEWAEFRGHHEVAQLIRLGL